MKAEQILELIASYPPRQKVEIDFLLKDFATKLASVSHKLTDAEVISLTALASYLFDRAADEFVSSASAHALLDGLRKTQN